MESTCKGLGTKAREQWKLLWESRLSSRETTGLGGSVGTGEEYHLGMRGRRYSTVF